MTENISLPIDSNCLVCPFLRGDVITPDGIETVKPPDIALCNNLITRAYCLLIILIVTNQNLERFKNKINYVPEKCPKKLVNKI